MPSGKQILLSLLSEYSQNKSSADQMENISERLKAALLLHGSTSHEMWNMVEKISWENHSTSEDGHPITNQGLMLKGTDVLLSDFFNLISEDKKTLEHIRTLYPEINRETIASALHMIWLLLKSVEWSKTYEDVEIYGNSDNAEREKKLENYQRKLREFREAPDDYS